MHYSPLLLTLVATVSAIDIRAHTGGSCAGAFQACTGINPNVCCTFNSGKSSVSVAAIPTSWRIRGESSTGGGCKYFANTRDSNGNREICMSYTSRGDRTGGKYKFIGRKRADDELCTTEQPSGGKCEATVKPNELGLEDGTVYNIAGLSDDKVEELVKIADAGASADEVPAEFQPLRR